MRNTTGLPPLELWGGIEPSIVRIGDKYFSQDSRCVHSQRIDDLDRFASLGIRAIRYPILWEATAPDGLDKADWRFADERLQRLRELNIQPIVGLVHHGSGPQYTNLLDPEFPDKLADYARAVAERFPWVEHYTPVNEPYTTARVSALYGLWYPHKQDDKSFVHALVNQCLGILRSMRAIREVNSAAQLIQTEDLGKTYGTDAMRELVDFTNDRRWLGLDLLFGRVQKDHPLWGYLTENGIKDTVLHEFVEEPCPPSIIGFDYYVRSERFWDHRRERYPAEVHSDYGGVPHADIDVARVAVEGMSGFDPLFAEAWERYQCPMAVTETHLGSYRDEALRWAWEIWQQADAARAKGMDVRAVTFWGLLGIYNWSSLLTVDDGQYEPGVFDLRAPKPRPTALARLARDLAGGRTPDFPVLDTPGWWTRWERLRYPPVRLNPQSDYRGAPLGHDPSPEGRSFLITGGGGELGRCFVRLAMLRGLAWRALLHSEMDITDPACVEAVLKVFRPWAVINAAGLHSPDSAEEQPERARLALAEGPAVLAAACARWQIPLVTFSSDQVFDGSKGDKYVESDPVAPLSAYGKYQAEGERRARDTWEETLVIRSGSHFSPYEERNSITKALNALVAGQPWPVAKDCTVTLTYVVDLCNDVLDLLIDGERGIWHIAHPQAMSWFEHVRLAAKIIGVDDRTLQARPMKSLKRPAPRPLYSALGSERGVLSTPLDQALGRYCGDCQVGWVTRISEEKRCRDGPRPKRMP